MCKFKDLILQNWNLLPTCLKADFEVLEEDEYSCDCNGGIEDDN